MLTLHGLILLLAIRAWLRAETNNRRSNVRRPFLRNSTRFRAIDRFLFRTQLNHPLGDGRKKPDLWSIACSHFEESSFFSKSIYWPGITFDQWKSFRIMKTTIQMP